MATIREFFIERWEAEQPAFRKVLAALPADNLEYAPHERCTKAGNLAWQLVDEQRGMVDLLSRGETTYEPAAHPPHDEIMTQWDRATDELRKTIASTDESKWDGRCKFIMGGNAVWEDTLRNMMWGYLFDMVHHRGQLSAYLRPMGGKVPSIYGPSADDHGA